ncbi:hypothetical protein P152DRAFT_513662 [Eremomyces bilateralis CBS 781.70]|uniref:Telomere-associated protein Rif1 N-terminal domain-containing protein n=1 Tax=Eremomyces bilateralis CBS 781.70 TaxID=1392243 RepID=A0A6G1G5V8_9PEZI|nr:uncharacterized protein P152DRAFT_513662 [Eremomyces bilateralis CBS 781.70]KAF1813434.1 hypothetical protein P152DRAFT_513662 [Eremomyces bilateralis CBS 781.70]
MVQVLSSDPFRRLSSREPTPPSENDEIIEETLQFLSSGLDIDNAVKSSVKIPANESAQDTPPASSPQAHTPSAAGSGSESKKKVAFSGWKNYHQAPVYTTDGTVSTPLKQLPPSRERRLLKSILKAQGPAPTVDSLSSPIPQHNNQTFGGMLDSISKQLTTEDMDNRNDAYTTLLASLQAFDNVPDASSLVEKLPLFTKAILQDMQPSSNPSAALNRLELNAIKLLAALLRIPQVADSVDVAFGQALLEEIIAAFHKPQVTKQRIIARLQLLVHLQIQPQMMNHDRMHRLLSGLKAIDSYRSNGILGTRLLVLHRLLKQVPDLISSHIPKFLPYMFHGFLSTHNEIRARAIELAVATGRALGDRPEITKGVKEVLERKPSNGQTYCEFLVQRLDVLLKDKHQSQDVPQIWASVVLMLRSGSPSARIKWPCMKTWLRLIQNCLNCSDIRTKVRAYMAWNCLIYTSQPDLDTSDQLRDLLLTPLKRRLSEKEDDSNRRLRSSALYSYCNLLYYALKPTASHEQLDIYWMRYVEKVIFAMPHGSRTSIIQISRTLMALLGGFPHKSWVEGRAIMDLGTNSMSCKPQELSPLEPQWIRTNTGGILQVLERILSPDSWNLGQGPDIDNVCSPRDVWLALLTAISDAGSKEINMTREAKTAYSHIFNFLFRFWKNHSSCKSKLFSSCFKDIITDMAQKLNPVIFVEKFLTPWDGSLQAQNTYTCGLFEIVELATSTHSEMLHDNTSQNYLETVQLMVQCALPGLPNSRSKLDLLSEAHGVLLTRSPSMRSESGKTLRDFFLSEVTAILDTKMSTLNSPTKLQQLFPPLLQIFKSSLRESTLVHWPSTSAIGNLHDTCVKAIKKSAGHAEVVRLLTEPLAKAILEEHKSEISVESHREFCISMLEAEVPPTVLAPAKSGPGSWKGKKASRGRKPAENCPYNYFFLLIDGLSQSMLRESTHGSKWNKDLPIRFICSLNGFLQRIPMAYRSGSLKTLQPAVCIWMNYSTPVQQGSGLRSSLIASVRELNEMMWRCIATIDSGKSLLLAAFEPFFKASLQSRYRSVLNVSIRECNACFGAETSLNYPSSLRDILEKLRSIADLQLPGLEDSTSQTPIHTQSYFFTEEDEKENATMPVAWPKSPLLRSTQSVPLSPSRRTNFPVDHTTQLSSVRRDPELRFPTRHDDSQVMFTSIEPSENPADTPFVMESQLLTERQKEVRDRQAQDKAMFSDLRSELEPSSVRKPATEPESKQSSNQFLHYSRQTRLTTPPVLQSRHSRSMEHYLSSSPTPGSAMKRREAMRHQSHEDPDFDEDIPSSPPEVEDPELERIMEVIPAETDGNNLEEEAQEPEAHSTDRKATETTDTSDGCEVSKLALGLAHMTHHHDSLEQPNPTAEAAKETMGNTRPVSLVGMEQAKETGTQEVVECQAEGSTVLCSFASGATAEISMTESDPSLITKQSSHVDTPGPASTNLESPASQLAWEAAESWRRELEVEETSLSSSILGLGRPADLMASTHAKVTPTDNGSNLDGGALELDEDTRTLRADSRNGPSETFIKGKTLATRQKERQLQTPQHDGTSEVPKLSDTNHVQVPCTDLKKNDTTHGCPHPQPVHGNIQSDEADVSRVENSFPSSDGAANDEGSNGQTFKRQAEVVVQVLSRKRNPDDNVFDKPSAKRQHLDQHTAHPMQKRPNTFISTVAHSKPTLHWLASKGFQLAKEQGVSEKKELADEGSEVVIPSTETGYLSAEPVHRSSAKLPSSRSESQDIPTRQLATNGKVRNWGSAHSEEIVRRGEESSARRTRSAGPLDIDTSFYRPDRTRISPKAVNVPTETGEPDDLEHNAPRHKRQRVDRSLTDAISKPPPDNGVQLKQDDAFFLRRFPLTPEKKTGALPKNGLGDKERLSPPKSKPNSGIKGLTSHGDVAPIFPKPSQTETPSQPMRSLMRASFDALSSLSPFRSFRNSQDPQNSQDPVDSISVPTTPSQRESKGKRKLEDMEHEEGENNTQEDVTETQPLRTIRTPRSMMEKLRGVLEDCKKLAFVGKEEREVDDLLFELRKEVHEAGRRGRDGEGH